MPDYDLAILGAGGAAFAAAIRAREQGLRVVLVERGDIGGTCVNVGCIPSKALLAAAETRAEAAASRFPGVPTRAGDVDLAALVRAKDEIVRELRAHKYEDLADEYGFEILRGEGRFVAGPALRVGNDRLEAAHYLVATGSTAWAPPIEGLDEVGYLTSTSALALDRVPRSLTVVGANYVGLELGQLFAHLGARVTLLEVQDRIAPNEEPEVSDELDRILRDEGVEIRTGVRIRRFQRSAEGVEALIEGGPPVLGEALLVATGRRPATAGIGLDAVGVRLGDRGEVRVDDHLRTDNPRIWAAGDVTGHPQFVYLAAAHGGLVVDNAFGGQGRRLDYRTLPRVTFTAPSVAAVGLTEAEAEAKGIDCSCRTVRLEHVPRAIVNRDTRGLVKLVAENGSGRLLGAHVLAPGAGDVILAAVYALENGMTVHDLAHAWCPYLTMAEGLKLAAQAFTKPIEKLSCCAM